MSKIEDCYSRERSNSSPETPKRFRSSPLEDSQSKRQKVRMSIAGEKAKEALEEASIWAKTPFLFMMEQMSKANEDVTNVKEQLEMFKLEVDGRVTQLEKEVKLMQSTYDATSSEMEGLKATFHLTISMRGQRTTGKIQRNNYYHLSCGTFLTGKTMSVFLIFTHGTHWNVKNH